MCARACGKLSMAYDAAVRCGCGCGTRLRVVASASLHAGGSSRSAGARYRHRAIVRSDVSAPHVSS